MSSLDFFCSRAHAFSLSLPLSLPPSLSLYLSIYLSLSLPSNNLSVPPRILCWTSRFLLLHGWPDQQHHGLSHSLPIPPLFLPSFPPFFLSFSLVIQQFSSGVWTSVLTFLLFFSYISYTYNLVWQWGKLADRYGRRPIMLLGLVGTLFSITMFGFRWGDWHAVLKCLSIYLISKSVYLSIHPSVGLSIYTTFQPIDDCMLFFYKLQACIFSCM